MNVITVPAEDKMLNKLLEQARQDGLILETVDGQRFMLISVEDWIGFEVGEGDDFEHEVELTGQHKALMEFLDERRSKNKRISLAKIKEQLGLD